MALLEGTARFVDPNTIAVRDEAGGERRLEAENVVIAAGSEPAHPEEIEFNGRTILDSDDIVLRLEKIPDVLVVIGAGVIGVEFASMFAALGTRVTVVDGRQEFLDFCDHEVTEALRYHLRDLNVVFRFGERVTRVQETELGTLTTLESGKQIPPTPSSTRPAARARPRRWISRRGARGRAARPDRGQRVVPDRRAAHLRRRRRDRLPEPRRDVGRAGGGSPPRTRSGSSRRRCRAPALWDLLDPGDQLRRPPAEHELTNDGVAYEVGIAHYRELARGHILGESHGMLKLLVAPVDRTLLGVHAIGNGATEVVHIGQAVMGLGGTIDYLVETVFNYPTLAEAYKVAALDAVNKLRAVSLHLGVT